MEQLGASGSSAEVISKTLKWIVPDSVETTYATHLLVQQQGSEFRLFFFEAELPLITGTPEEQAAAFRDLPEVNAKCVAKLVITADNIGLVANNLLESLNKFNAMLIAAREKVEKNERDPDPTGLPVTN